MVTSAVNADFLQSRKEGVKEAAVNHYHIRWSESKLDWEAFGTREEAETAAKQLVRPNENYSIEQFDGHCPRCGEMRPRDGGRAPTAGLQEGNPASEDRESK